VKLAFLVTILGLLSLSAVEMTLDFGEAANGSVPEGYRAVLAGEGRPGQWEVVRTAVPSALEPLSPMAVKTATKAVLTQTDFDRTDERFPMLVYDAEIFGDFTLTVRFRILAGETEQMAGVAFRLQDERNFYVLRASALGRNVRFYKVADGVRDRLLGPTLDVTTNVWHELTVKCTGNEIICMFNGSPILPPLQDASFPRGKVAFWTKSDSVCQFEAAQITYTPVVPLSQRALAAALERYPRVLDLKLYVLDSGSDVPRVTAAQDPSAVGSSGGKSEALAIREASISTGRSKGRVIVVLPVRDRNGEPVAAARVVMESFSGQTDDNALARARPVVDAIERVVVPSLDPFD